MLNEGQPGGLITAGQESSEQRETDPGALFVVSAPSGAGKSTLVHHVLDRDDRLRFSVSYTTRKPRGSERDGLDYHFVSEAEFAAMRERGEFLESAEVHGFLYGTNKELIQRILATGYDAILDIDVQGADQIRRNMPGAVTVFVLPPSVQALQDRLVARNLNEAWDVERRIQNAAQEVRLFHKFDYVIVNDDLERATAALQSVIVAQRQRPDRQRIQAQAIIDTFGGEPFHA